MKYTTILYDVTIKDECGRILEAFSNHPKTRKVNLFTLYCVGMTPILYLSCFDLKYALGAIIFTLFIAYLERQ